jgi:conjugal transfer/entry exclusion protein
MMQNINDLAKIPEVITN